MPDSILDSIKDPCGVSLDDTSFDTDIIMYINGVFAALTQMGVGPVNGMTIHSKEDDWSTYSSVSPFVAMVKNYLHLKVRLMFDPPSSQNITQVFEKQADMYEWRLIEYVERGGAV